MQFLQNFEIVQNNTQIPLEYQHLVTGGDWSSNRVYRRRQRELTLSLGCFLAAMSDII